VDYLRADTSQTDLLTTPVLVDPGEETRGRLPRLLEAFAQRKLAGTAIGHEVSVMTAEDQHKAAEAGRAIRDGRTVDYALWPGYVDRDQLAEVLADYADDAASQREDADYIIDSDLTDYSPEMIGVNDDIEERINRMAATREQLRAAARDGVGLTSMERAQLDCTIEDIDAGRIRGREELPELIWTDERTKAAADQRRIDIPATDLARATRAQITELVATAGVEPGTREASRLRFEVGSLGDSLYIAATGALGSGMDAEAKSFVTRRDKLGRTLAEACVEPSVKQKIRAVIDTAARDAGARGRAAVDRNQRWQAKTDGVIAARDDAIAQRHAATAGIAAQNGRGCTTRPDRVAQAHAPAPAGRRNLHSAEVGR
ncbi:hypothetical protein, partial [Streptomyces sp. NPDC056056]|uniref:hypothetical protein n=1 Tax=Streptomyces sp. NPDC056056 TaxID=3345698 RepID=UPI0035E22734